MSVPADIRYFIGRNLSNCKLSGASIDGATGVVTLSTAHDIASSAVQTWRSVTFDFETETVDIHAANAGIKNQVPTVAGITAEITEITSANGGSFSLGDFMSFSYVLLQVITTTGGAVPVLQLIQFIGTCKSLHLPYEQDGSAAVLTLVESGYPIYVGDPTTPLYS